VVGAVACLGNSGEKGVGDEAGIGSDGSALQEGAPGDTATPEVDGKSGGAESGITDSGMSIPNHVLGAASPPFGNGSTTAYVAAFGAQPHVMEMYWPLLQNPYPATEGTSFPCSVLQADQESGVVLMTLIPGDNDAGAGAASEPTEAEITNGMFDVALSGWATGIAACGQRVLLRFGHEMNGNWYAWSPGQNGNPADGSGFIAMWQHVWNLFQQNGASTSLVRWVFSPNVPSGGSTPTPISAVYPGDSYVDVLALDGYNWGTGNGNQWQTFTEVFSDGYAQVADLNPTKPMMVAETGCATSSGDSAKGDWITSALGEEIPSHFPRFETIVYFDYDYNGDDWALDSGPLTMSAFAAQAQSAFWNHIYPW
jgi:hypothetical protein